jgi:murein DD-endopeptidase MepM/ murein hydrolase activator NlpD
VLLHSNTAGVVTKIGYPYEDDLSYRYIEITDNSNYKHRYFYVCPAVKVGQRITAGKMIGTVQNIAARYTKNGKMRNHVHYEIIDKDGYYRDPSV